MKYESPKHKILKIVLEVHYMFLKKITSTVREKGKKKIYINLTLTLQEGSSNCRDRLRRKCKLRGQNHGSAFSELKRMNGKGVDKGREGKGRQRDNY